MAKSGIQHIDRLFYKHPGMAPIVESDSDTELVSFTRNLRIGHGYFRKTTVNNQTRKKFTPILFGLEDKQRSVFEDKARDALLDFRKRLKPKISAEANFLNHLLSKLLTKNGRCAQTANSSVPPTSSLAK